MSNPPYRALRIILGIFSVFTAAAGLLIVFNGKPLVGRQKLTRFGGFRCVCIQMGTD